MLDRFERYPLTFGPTPIEKLDRLSEHLGGAVEIYAKREDCNAGLAFGGNKIRKLEYIVPDAIAFHHSRFNIAPSSAVGFCIHCAFHLATGKVAFTFSNSSNFQYSGHTGLAIFDP